jgi:hypothetical protein
VIGIDFPDFFAAVIVFVAGHFAGRLAFGVHDPFKLPAIDIPVSCDATQPIGDRRRSV